MDAPVAWLVLAGVAASLGAACSLDHRTLTLAGSGGGDASSQTAGESSTGGDSSMPTPGVGGASAGADSGSVPIPVCSYGGSVAKGCETLVDNPGFARDVASWDLDGGVLGTWQETDAQESKTSGSIAVLNTLSGTDDGVAPGAARQCLPGKPGSSYDLATDVLIEPGQGDGEMPGAPYEGSAVLGAFFFDTPDCQGTSVGFLSADPVSKTGKWQHVSVSGVAPAETRAISVRLGTMKPIRQYFFEATFDNVLVRERAR